MSLFDCFIRFFCKSVIVVLVPFFLVVPTSIAQGLDKDIKLNVEGLFPDSTTSNAAEAATSQENENKPIMLRAKLTSHGADIKSGLIWRIYSPFLGLDNKLPLVETYQGGTAQIKINPGSYIVHVSFGRAEMVRRININKDEHIDETFVLNAGGLRLHATLVEGKINEKRLRFFIYKDDDENEEESLVIGNVKPDSLVRLKEGDYRIVSNYGSANSVARSDIRVEAGKITDLSLQHRAAQVTLKLVSQEGGGALADTSWSISNDSGDIVRETVGAYASLVLIEGDYLAVAKNKDQIYQKAFSVTTGRDEEIDVVANAKNQQNYDGAVD